MTDVAAQATDASSFHVALDTTNAGVFTGNASASFVSHDAELADSALAGSSITLRGQINNFAEGTLRETAGTASFAKLGNVYTLDFGSVMLGASKLMATLGVFNTALGPADLLNGMFDTSAVGPEFLLSNFAGFSDIAAGSSLDGFGIAFSSAMLGAFEDRIVFRTSGHNASGFAGDLAVATLLLRGNVTQTSTVPEPPMGLLTLSGLALLWFARRWQLSPDAAA